MQILDDTFASQMQQLLGHTLQEKDVEPPRSVMHANVPPCKMFRRFYGVSASVSQFNRYREAHRMLLLDI